LSEIQEIALLLLQLGFKEVEMVQTHYRDIRAEERVELILMDIFRTINHIRIISTSKSKWYFPGGAIQIIS